MKYFSKKIRLILLFLILIAVCIYAVLRYLESRIVRPTGLPTRGGQKLQIEIPCPYFSQQDSRWAEDEMGASGGNLANYGCTLCSASMSLNALGIESDPKSLNQHFSETGGYTESGLLIWEALRKVAGDDYQMVIKDRATHAYLDEQLSAGTPVIAKVLWKRQIWHWVLITGKEGDQYLVADPLVPDNAHLEATHYPDGFFSVRHLVRREE